MRILFLPPLAFLATLIITVASYAADVRPIPQAAKPQNGVFVQANGYSSTVLELKNGYFRYWFKSDISFVDPVTHKEILYPLTGKYFLKGDAVILEHAQINQKQWAFRTLNGVLTLWRPEAIVYYNREKRFDPYGILRITNKSAEKAWAEPE